MINDELFAKFDSLEDLPISEEILGAYMEDNLSPAELTEVENSIQENDFVSSIVNSSIDIEGELDSDGLTAYPNLDEIQLPNIPEDSFIDIDLSFTHPLSDMADYDYAAACAYDDGYSHNDIYSNNDLENLFEDDDSSLDSSDDNNDLSYE